MGGFLQDCRYGLRTFFKRPAFTLVAVLTLALGIGANSAVYTFLNAALFGIPFQNDGRTVFIYSSNKELHNERALVSVPNFDDWRTAANSFEELAAQGSESLTLTGDGTPERLQATYVTGNFFRFVDGAPLIGRLAERNDEAVLSYGFWQRRYGGDPSVPGRVITLNGRQYTISGVMQRKVWFPSVSTALWLPLETDSSPSRSASFLMVFGRLKSGLTVDHARVEMETITRRLEEAYPDANSGLTSNVLTVDQALLKDTDRAVMRLLIITVMFVLLIACANISNLLLSRGVGRQKEVAVRTALGATRGRIIRQLLVESLLLAVAGGIVGAGVGAWGGRALVDLIPHRAPPPDTLLDVRIFGLTMLLSFVSAAVFGLVPAFEVSRSDVNATLKEGGRSGTGNIRGRRFRNALVVLEVMLTMVLLVGAGLVIRTSIVIRNMEPGFARDGLLALNVEIPSDRYKSPAEIDSFYTRALAELRAVPGLQSAATTSHVPIMNDGDSTRFVLKGAEAAPIADRPQGAHIEVSADFFKALGLTILKGREFTSQDTAGTSKVAVISETLARRYFTDKDPIGESIALSEDNGAGDWMTIVGVARDSRPANLRQGVRPQIYIPAAQRPHQAMIFVVRAQRDPASMAAASKAAIWAVDPNLPFDQVSTVDQLIENDFRGGIALSYVFAVFGVLALALATIGIYGVISYVAAQRTREIGIRLALGATRGDVMRIVVGQGMIIVSAGAALGVVGGMALTRVLANALIGVSSTDPVTFIGATALLMSVALVATYLPARRVMRVDPIEALRYE